MKREQFAKRKVRQCRMSASEEKENQGSYGPGERPMGIGAVLPSGNVPSVDCEFQGIGKHRTACRKQGREGIFGNQHDQKSRQGLVRLPGQLSFPFCSFGEGKHPEGDF